MRLLLLIAFLGLVVMITALPTSPENKEKQNSLIDVADAGDLHSNDADRQARTLGWGWGWGPGYGWGGPGYGWGGWGGRRYGWGWGGW